MKKFTAEDLEKKIHGSKPAFLKGQVITDSELMKALEWYRSMKDRKDSKRFTIEHLVALKTDPVLVAKVKQLADHNFANLGFLCEILKSGVVVAEKQKENFEARVKALLDLAQNVELKTEVASTKPVVSIQDKMKVQVSHFLADIDAMYDDAFKKGFTATFSIKSMIVKHGLKAQHAKLAMEVYKKVRDEMDLVVAGTDAQLVEAYKPMGRTAQKRAAGQLQKIMDELQELAISVQRKARVKKVKSPEELTKGVKLAPNSKPAASLIGATTALVYNTKYRRLGILTADTSQGFSVEGTTVKNLKTTLCTGKTIRENKVDATFKAIAAATGDIAARKIYMEIKASAAPISGRLNEETLLLATYK